MAKLTKKQKQAIEMCKDEIHEIIAGSLSLAVENKWNDTDISIRSMYDTYRIINIIQDKLYNI